jgi:TRAP-type C4-dicarboxylate transport system permease small subunit
MADPYSPFIVVFEAAKKYNTNVSRVLHQLTMQEKDDSPSLVKPRIPITFESVLAAIVMAALALITFANVLVRYFTDRSFAWTEEISVFLMIVLALVAGSAAFAKNHHIRIEFFTQRFSAANQLRLAQSSAFLGALLFAIIAVLSARLAWDDYRYEEVSAGIGVPQWWYSIWLPVLSTVIMFRLLGLITRFRKRS